ncbi:MAG: hypothetical protein H7832_03730 [Magnetococcus sp. DMHC-6]
MKKSLLLGAAAFAAMAYVGSANAGDVKVGGYYMFRALSQDSTLADDGNDDTRNWKHRLQVRTDFKASEKTHAHAILRILGSDMVENVDGQAATGAGIQVNQAWLETEAWGIGLKVGEMPIGLNDNILVNNVDDEKGFGTILLSKSFGDVTAILADVRVADGTTIGTPTAQDDMDLYVLSLLGSANPVNYQVTGAYFDDQTAGDADDFWLAATVGGDFSGVNATGTVIYENGVDVAGNGQAQNDGFLGALRLKGKTGFGGWNAYGLYSSADFDSIVGNNAHFSQTWDHGGPGAKDLLGDEGFASAQNSTTANAADTENMWSIGAGLTFESAGWTINPMLDYAAVVDENPNNAAGGSQFKADSAWGGTLALSTDIDKDTKLTLAGTYVDPDANAGAKLDNMYNVSADVNEWSQKRGRSRPLFFLVLKIKKYHNKIYDRMTSNT